MRRKAFPGFGPEVDARYQRAGKWLRAAIFRDGAARDWCGQNGIPLRKAAAEGIDPSGGFLVPIELTKAIFDLREQYGAFRRRARIVPMATDSVHVPRHSGVTAPGGASTAYFFGENTAATTTPPGVDSVNLVAKKIGSLVQLSTELDEDADPDVIDYIANEIAWAFASKEDDCAFNGDGTSTYGGMFGISQVVLDGKHATAKVTAASGHNTFQLLDQTDLGNLLAAVRASAIPNAAWFCSQTCFALTFCRLSAGAGGGYIYIRNVDGIETPFYLGFPVILSQKLPTGTGAQTGKVMLAFGDMYAGGVLGQRRAITLARSYDRYLDQDQLAILGTERFDAIIHDIGDNSNAGSLACLVSP